MLPGGAPAARRRPSGAGAGVAVVLVMGAFVVGHPGLGRSTASRTPTTSRPPPPRSPSPSPRRSPPRSPALPPPPADAPALVNPAGVQALDPQGDGEENDQEAPRAIDGDPASSWTSDRYNSAAFGNLKDGLGLSFDLGAPADIGSVVVTAPGSGGTYEVRVADGPGFDGSTVVADGRDGRRPGHPRPRAAPVTSQFVVIWFTTLPELGGEFRGAVSEVQVQVP